MLHITLDPLDLMKGDKRTFVIAEISPCVREERIPLGFAGPSARPQHAPVCLASSLGGTASNGKSTAGTLGGRRARNLQSLTSVILNGLGLFHHFD